VILADVSLSVRATARFTLHLVHGLQSLFGQVRTFAFVADLVEITDLFEDHPVEQALGLVFGGDVLDVDANSDYGAAFGRSTRTSARRSTALHGDRPRRRRGNGNDPTSRPSPRSPGAPGRRSGSRPSPGTPGAWAAATCPCTPSTAARAGGADLTGLESAAQEMATELVGR
jgi:hypothetical protein